MAGGGAVGPIALSTLSYVITNATNDVRSKGPGAFSISPVGKELCRRKIHWSGLSKRIKLKHLDPPCVQIIERQELKRRETEENHRYDAKIEAEMMAYNPWGRCGGGASIKDGQGNLISKLGLTFSFDEVNK